MDMFSEDLIRCFISKLKKKHAKEMIDVLWSVLHALGTQLRARKRKELLQSAIHGQDLGAKDKSRVIYGSPLAVWHPNQTNPNSAACTSMADEFSCAMAGREP